MRFQSPRGTEDVLPSDAYRWLYVEETFRKVVGTYGYQEIRTPTFEETELFTRSVGETSDIVTKEMYEFSDKGGRSMTLKPEGTAGVMRALIQHSLCPAGTITRLSYVIPIFRYERPQKGRLREAHQVGLELVGSPSPTADAEVIEATVSFYRAIGIHNVSVSLNSIGRARCRESYRTAILHHMADYLADCDADFRARAEKNPMRLLDSKDPSVQAALEGLPPITSYLEEESRAAFDTLQDLLTYRKVPFVLVPEIVRGLDYYTDTVFEVVSSDLGSQNSLCGGGRYDNLVKELGGTQTPSVGVAMGIERALIVMNEMQIQVDRPRAHFFIVADGDAAAIKRDEVASQLRSSGISAVVDPDGRSFKSQLRQADKSGARYMGIIGSDEMEKGTIQIKNLQSGNQVEVPVDSLLERLGEFA